MSKPDRNKPVKIEYKPTFDERRHGEHGYEVDNITTEEELRSFAAPALAGFKGESLQQAAQTHEADKNPSEARISFPGDTTAFREHEALEALARQQERERTGGFLGASNAHMTPRAQDVIRQNATKPIQHPLP